jgi:hypothetical protein
VKTTLEILRCSGEQAFRIGEIEASAKPFQWA